MLLFGGLTHEATFGAVLPLPNSGASLICCACYLR